MPLLVRPAGRRPLLTALGFVAVLAAGASALDRYAGASQAAPPPQFQVDPFWPKLPKQWILGQVSGVAVDAQDHVWVLQRPWSLNSDELKKNPEAECCTAAPPVMEFDAAGNYLRGWGGAPADGAFEWPADEHGIHVDYKGNVWISSAGGPRLREGKENFLLKFTRDGKFLLQIGRRGQSQGSSDTANLNNAADMWVHPATNEVYVADGYGNHRVIVFDADTGAYKRMWVAFGNKPVDDDHCEVVAPKTFPEGKGPANFSIVHALRVASDGMVYVADRENRRVQAFTPNGTFVKQLVKTDTQFARNLALSHDPVQQFLYVGNGMDIAIVDRRSMEIVGTIKVPGMIGGGHQIAVDSKGNLYIAGTTAGLQKLTFKGMAVPKS